MILEEIIGTLASLGSTLITQVPPISRENPQSNMINDYELHQNVIHREYELAEEPTDLPYYEDISDVAAVLSSTQCQASRTFCESLRRSFQVNFGFLVAVVLLGLVVIALVYVDLNTSNSCIEWRHYNHSIPYGRRVLQIIGKILSYIPIYNWFSVSAAMLWGFKAFKEKYLSCLFLSCFTMSIGMVYRAVIFDRYVALIFR